LTSGRRPIVKIIAESLLQYDEKHVGQTPLSGIRVGKRKKKSVEEGANTDSVAVLEASSLKLSIQI
jgi:hypothetical protein